MKLSARGARGVAARIYEPDGWGKDTTNETGRITMIALTLGLTRQHTRVLCDGALKIIFGASKTLDG